MIQIRKNWGFLLWALCFFFAFTLIAADLADARGGSGSSGGGGGDRSGGSGVSSSSSGRTSSGPGWGSSSPSKPSGSWGSGPSTKPSSPTSAPKANTEKPGWGASEKPAAAKTTDPKAALAGTRGAAASAKASPSKVDKAFAEKAKAQGTSFTSRDAAVKDFQTKNAAKYPSKYDKEPATRPGHIPQTTMVGGSNVTVIYNPMFGGYGYMYGGSWVAYSMMADAAMMNATMHRQGYYYGQPVASAYGFLIGFIVFCCLIGLGIAIIRRL